MKEELEKVKRELNLVKNCLLKLTHAVKEMNDKNNEIFGTIKSTVVEMKAYIKRPMEHSHEQEFAWKSWPNMKLTKEEQDGLKNYTLERHLKDQNLQMQLQKYVYASGIPNKYMKGIQEKIETEGTTPYPHKQFILAKKEDE